MTKPYSIFFLIFSFSKYLILNIKQDLQYFSSSSQIPEA